MYVLKILLFIQNYAKNIQIYFFQCKNIIKLIHSYDMHAHYIIIISIETRNNRYKSFLLQYTFNYDNWKKPHLIKLNIKMAFRDFLLLMWFFFSSKDFFFCKRKSLFIRKGILIIFPIKSKWKIGNGNLLTHDCFYWKMHVDKILYASNKEILIVCLISLFYFKYTYTCRIQGIEEELTTLLKPTAST